MKKYLYQFFVALMAISSFTLVSCSDDGDGEEFSSDIVGTWKSSLSEMEAVFGEQYIQFDSDGQFIEVDILGLGSDEVEIMKGQWKRSGNTIIISGNDIITTTTEIMQLTDNNLTLATLGIPMSYKRVPDSEIEKYLK